MPLHNNRYGIRTHREEISTSGLLFGQQIVTYSFFSPLKIH
jgi:hypothetical protein